jgi:hypothetical protein
LPQLPRVMKPRPQSRFLLHLDRVREELHLRRRPGETQIADVVEAKAKTLPSAELAHRVHAKKDVERVGELRPHDAHRTSARTGGDRLRVDNRDTGALFDEIERRAQAERAGSDDDDVRGSFHAIAPRLQMADHIIGGKNAVTPLAQDA